MEERVSISKVLVLPGAGGIGKGATPCRPRESGGSPENAIVQTGGLTYRGLTPFTLY